MAHLQLLDFAANVPGKVCRIMEVEPWKTLSENHEFELETDSDFFGMCLTAQERQGKGKIISRNHLVVSL